MSRTTFENLMLRTWPALWPIVRSLDGVLPDRLVKKLAGVWEKEPYDTWYRDVFFPYVLTRYYNYPIRKGDIVVQVGASYGEETKRFLEGVGKKGRVVAIEPDTTNVEVMKRLLPPSKYPQIILLQMAISNQSGEGKLLLGSGKQHRLAGLNNDAEWEFRGTKAKLLPDDGFSRTTIIPIKTLGELLPPYGFKQVDFVLIETNGAETEVVEGIGAAAPLIKHIAARGHVSRNGQFTCELIAASLESQGFTTTITDEKMVLGKRR